ncbi:EamA family transporter [Candidatus Woesearchaeota archaeon]|nr:EamA family transporter [Candidatus Woesearchaeota archaeon]
MPPKREHPLNKYKININTKKMGNTKLSAIILIIISTLFISAAQVFYKLASKTMMFDISTLFNYYLYIGLLLYGIAAVLLILALKNGELSTIYPMIATSYLWVILLSIFVFNESINLFKWIGVTLIIIGVAILGGKS